MSMNEHPLTCPNVPNVPKTRQYMNFYGVVREPLNCAYTLCFDLCAHNDSQLSSLLHTTVVAYKCFVSTLYIVTLCTFRELIN